ncbi:MAG: ammonium transporter [Pseudomonadota bacterium]|nr:ammonium transporter [Pseudomonadota bacterium]
MITNTFRKCILPNNGKLLNALAFVLVLSFSFNVGADAHGENPAVSLEVAYILNTFLFLVCGFLVMFMAAGFCMLEAGMVRSKNTAVICLKNIGLFSIAGIMYYLVGYNLMYVGVDGGFLGSFSLFDRNSEVDLETGYAAASDWFFQMVFVATAASIVSGALAERILIWPFFLFVAILTGIIYPIAGSWQWGGGWLSEMGFSDFAGSTLVHSVGGWAALAGAILLGARDGKYSDDGSVNIIPGCSLPMTTLGVFILWLGWFGFNGGSQLALGSGADATAVADIFVNTSLAAAAGVIACMVISKLTNSHTNISATLNGAIAGLVAITAEPLNPSMGQAIIIGAVGGIICMYGMKLLDTLRIDDVVGAIPAHLFAGIWGTLIVAWTNSDASLSVQLIGVVSYGLFTLIISFILWFVIKTVIGIRANKDDEEYGLDMSELGAVSYPDFTKK